MKRLLSLCIVLAVVALTLSLAPVRHAEAAPPGCACAECYQTPQEYGLGVDCPAALADLKARAMAHVGSCENGRCSLRLVITVACHYDTYTGLQQYDGYYEYCCWACVD